VIIHGKEMIKSSYAKNGYKSQICLIAYGKNDSARKRAGRTHLN